MSSNYRDVDKALAVLAMLRDHQHEHPMGVNTHISKTYLPQDTSLSNRLGWFVRYGIILSQRGYHHGKDVRFYRLGVSYEEAVTWLHRRALGDPLHKKEEVDEEEPIEEKAKGVTAADLAWMEKYRERYQQRKQASIAARMVMDRSL